MTDAYVGEIRWMPYLRGAPEGWLLCDGSQQPIQNYEMLYALIGTTYGGDGSTTFGLPDLRGRVPLHQGAGPGRTARPLASSGGTETVTLVAGQLGQHNHLVQATSAAATATAPAQTLTLGAVGGGDTQYDAGPPSAPSATLSRGSVQMAGVGGPHDNCAPSLPINACICCVGVFPTQP